MMSSEYMKQAESRQKVLLLGGRTTAEPTAASGDGRTPWAPRRAGTGCTAEEDEKDEKDEEERRKAWGKGSEGWKIDGEAAATHRQL